MKNLYLHIGAHKTGTTAIQKFLSMNRDNLKKKGYLYPGIHDAHHFIPEKILMGNQLHDDSKNHIEQLFKEIQSSDLKNIIISSENFENLKEKVPELKNLLKNKFDCKIIYYVRRQDERLESLYRGNVKNPTNRLQDTLAEYYTKFDTVSDYYSLLSPWREAFGEKNIFVRVYEKGQLPHGIYQDFLTIIGLEWDNNLNIPTNQINRGLGWDLTEIIRLCNIQFPNDPNLHQFLVRNLSKVQINEKEKNYYGLSPQQRRNIVKHYDKSNVKVAREYLGREDGRLFYAPLPDPNEPWEPYEGLTIEEIVPIFTQMLYNMDLKYQKKFRKLHRHTISGKNYGFGKYLSGIRLRIIQILKR